MEKRWRFPLTHFTLFTQLIFIFTDNFVKNIMRSQKVLFALCLKGFDEYMNLVLDDAEEVHMKTKNRKPLGKCELCDTGDSCVSEK